MANPNIENIAAVRPLHARARMGHGLLCGTQNSGEVAQRPEDLTCPQCLVLVAADVSQTGGRAALQHDKLAHEKGPALAMALRKVTTELRPRLAGSLFHGDSARAHAALAEAEALLNSLDAVRA